MFHHSFGTSPTCRQQSSYSCCVLSALSSSCLLLGQQGAPPAGCTVHVVQLDAILLVQSLNKLPRQIWKTETQNDLILNTYVHLNMSCLCLLLKFKITVSCVLQCYGIINIYVSKSFGSTEFGCFDGSSITSLVGR